MKPAQRPISRYMSRAPQTIGPAQTMAEAHRLMRDHRIRHLPVIDGTRLVGIVSERDLHLVETLRDVDPEQVTVDDAMTPDPYVVSPETPIEVVARAMADRRVGSAIVVEDDAVVGVFTATDALYALTTVTTVTEPRRPDR